MCKIAEIDMLWKISGMNITLRGTRKTVVLFMDNSSDCLELNFLRIADILIDFLYH